MSQLANQLVIAEKEEVAQGIRQLLATPLVTERSHPETFDLVRRRREPIRKEDRRRTLEGTLGCELK